MSEIERSCPLGYTVDDIAEITGERQGKFWLWMRGQTLGVCDGTKFNHNTGRYEYTACKESPHGTVVYPIDVETFLAGRPPLD